MLVAGTRQPQQRPDRPEAGSFQRQPHALERPQRRPRRANKPRPVEARISRTWHLLGHRRRHYARGAIRLVTQPRWWAARRTGRGRRVRPGPPLGPVAIGSRPRRRSGDRGAVIGSRRDVPLHGVVDELRACGRLAGLRQRGDTALAHSRGRGRPHGVLVQLGDLHPPSAGRGAVRARSSVLGRGSGVRPRVS